jgi:hypothetical protein
MAAIVAGDILTKYSVAGAASAGNATAGSATTTWQGKYMSSTTWAGGGTNDVFPDITGAQNAASQVDYACIFVHNTNTANSYQTCVVSIQSEVAGGASVAIAVDSTAATVYTSAPVQALAPSSSTASGDARALLTYGSSATLGTLQSQSGTNTNVRAFWIRRTAANSAALSGDGVTLSITGDTGSL